MSTLDTLGEVRPAAVAVCHCAEVCRGPAGAKKSQGFAWTLERSTSGRPDHSVGMTVYRGTDVHSTTQASRDMAFTRFLRSSLYFSGPRSRLLYLCPCRWLKNASPRAKMGACSIRSAPYRGTLQQSTRRIRSGAQPGYLPTYLPRYLAICTGRQPAEANRSVLLAVAGDMFNR